MEKRKRYDNQGRVIEYSYNSHQGGISKSYKYTYSDTKIIADVTAKDGSYNVNYTNTYYLTDGKIVKEVQYKPGNSSNPETIYYTHIYTYDSQGRITNETCYYDKNNTYSWETKYTWSDNNIVKINNGTIEEYTYTNIPWPQGMFFEFRLDSRDYVLCCTGYYGKLSSNMPSSVYEGYDNMTPYLKDTYEYTLSGGNIETLQIYFPQSGNTRTLTYTWQ